MKILGLIMDRLDDMWYWLNWVSRLIGLISRLIHPSVSGRFGSTVELSLRRLDKGGTIHIRKVVDHLHRHGVPTFDHLHDSQNFYFSVRKSQLGWAN